MKYFLIFLFVICVFVSNASAFEAGPALTDREVIESLTELKIGQAGLDKRFDQLNSLMLCGFGVMFTGIFALIGFVLWDRRTALAPAIKKNEAIERALIGYSENHPDMKEELKHAGVL